MKHFVAGSGQQTVYHLECVAMTKPWEALRGRGALPSKASLPQ